MKYKYITIEREYGSGGTQIARKLAERFGVLCYGREIIEAVANDQNLSTSQIDAYEETVSSSFLYSVYLLSKAQTGDPDMLSKEGHIYIAEQEAIRRFAAAGPAVFVGHCASESLKGENGLLKVFIHANNETKIKRAVEEYGIPEHSAENTIQRYDRKRERYYYANTTRKWRQPDNYDLILNSSSFGILGCVDVLEMIISHDFIKNN